MDALATYEPKSQGLFLKFADGDEIKLRVFTLDPLITEKIWDNAPDKIDTKYHFVVWNFNEGKPQIWSVGPGLLNQLVRIHRSEHFPALNKLDILVSAAGERLERRYDVQVLPKTENLSNDQVRQAAALKLEDNVNSNRGRLSEYENEEERTFDVDEDSGYAKAKKAADALGGEATHAPDEVIEDDGGEIDLSDIPF